MDMMRKFVCSLLMFGIGGIANAGPEGFLERESDYPLLLGSEPAANVSSAHTSAANMVVSGGSSSEGLELEGRGNRFVRDATTDVWALV